MKALAVPAVIADAGVETSRLADQNLTGHSRFSLAS